MQITINVPDYVPAYIVHDYVSTIEKQIDLIAETIKPRNLMSQTIKKKRVSFEDILSLAQECTKLPILDSRSADEILGYDESELGLFGAEYGH
jgi:hypothetical protein